MSELSDKAASPMDAASAGVPQKAGLPDARTIWKYPLPQPVMRLSMPADASVIDVRTQFGVPTLWALCTANGEVREREFIGFGTGHPIWEDGLIYVGSAHNVEGEGLVFHIFERPLT